MSPWLQRTGRYKTGEGLSVSNRGNGSNEQQMMITGVHLAGSPLENNLCIWVNLENILHLLRLWLTRPVLAG